MVSFSFINAIDPTTVIFIVLLVVLIVALLVVPLFTNKKRAKQTEELHRSLRPGDVVKTVGGIIGTIKEVREVSPVDKEMVIETGSGDNKSTMTFDIQALYQVMSRATTVVAAPEKEEAPVAEENSAAVEEPVKDEAPVAEETAEPAIAVPEDAPKAEEAAVEEPAEEPVEEKPATQMAPKSNSSAKKSNSSTSAKKSTSKKK